jgi:hypothetical protein
VHVTLVVDNVALGQVSSLYISAFACPYRSTVTHSYVHLHAILTRRKRGRNLETYKQGFALPSIGEHQTEKNSTFFFLQTSKNQQ